MVRAVCGVLVVARFTCEDSRVARRCWLVPEVAGRCSALVAGRDTDLAGCVFAR
jgi:hypothetical protein